MNNRRKFFLSVGASAFLHASVGFAQPKSKIWRIGYLSLPSIQDPPLREWRAFLEGMREHGYVINRDYRLISRSAEGMTEFLEDMARDLVQQKVDVIVLFGSAAALAVAKATNTIPVVILAVGDPVGIGAVASLRRPGANITGVSFSSTDLTAKRMALLREALPAARRIALLWNPNNRNAQIEADVSTVAARQLGLALEPIPLSNNADLESVLRRLANKKPDALYAALSTGPIMDNRSRIAEFGLQQGIPVISGWDLMTEAGGLLSYSTNLPTIFRRGAYYVDRILKGTLPGDLPIELPMTFELVVNLKTAKALGLTMSPEIMVQATRVIQ